MEDLFRFTCSALPAAPRVLAFTCEEELGRPYALSVYVDAEMEPGDVEGALGQPGDLTFDRMSLHGVVLEVELLLAVDARRIYRLGLAPTLQALSIGHHSRVYIEKSVPEILSDLLDRNEITPYELRLSGTYEKRRHVCQYRESDLDFLHRWMEREGIYYYFLQEDGAAKLVITDDIARHDDAEAAQIRYFPSGRGDVLAGESIHTWRRVHAAVTEDVTLADYDYRKPALAIRGEKLHAAVGFEGYVRFEDNLQDQREAERLAGARAEALKAAQIRFHGRSRVRGLHAGLCFALQDHPRDALNLRYQITRVKHHGTMLHQDPALARYLGLPPEDEAYHVLVEALPRDMQYRLERRAAWPEVRGVESAVVDGSSESPYAQIDAEGRYKVRLLFDEAGSPDGSSSAWLRMMQPHGGSPEAHHFPLRKGTEVLVEFVHGDPDRPFILGAVPTRGTPSTVTSANSTRNVIQTGSLSRIEIDDLAGKQYVDVSTPPGTTFLHLGAHAGLGDHNIVLSTLGDGLHNAGGKRDISVGGAQTEDVGGDLKEEYESNQTTHVFGAFTETVNAGKTQTIAAGATQAIDGGLTQTISGGETRTVDGGATETITGGRKQDITGATVESVGGALSQTVSGFISVSTPATYLLNAAAGITMMTPGPGMLKGLGGVKLVAPAGQMTVDFSHEHFGQQNIFAYGAKLTIGKLRIAATLNWYRRQLVHLAGYGVKVDIKAVDVKAWGSENLYGVLSARKAAADAKKNAQTQIGPGAGGPPGAPPGGGAAPGSGAPGGPGGGAPGSGAPGGGAAPPPAAPPAGGP